MRLPNVTSVVLLSVFVAALIWLVLVFISPYLVQPGTLTDLSGSVGAIDNQDQFASLSPVPKAIYSIGDRECHQIADRSYFLNGNQMPFCARDVGLFVGIVGGFGITSFLLLTPNILLLMLGLVPVGIDGGLQLLTNYESTNIIRLSTGIVGGLALALIIAQFVFALQKDRSESMKSPGTSSQD